MTQKVLHFPCRWLRPESRGTLRSAVGSYRTDDLSRRLEGRRGWNWTLRWQRRELRCSLRWKLSRSEHHSSSGTKRVFHTIVTEFWSDPKITQPLWCHAALHSRLSAQEQLWLKSVQEVNIEKDSPDDVIAAGLDSTSWLMFGHYAVRATSSYDVTDAVITQPGGSGLISQPASGFLRAKTCVLILVCVLLAHWGHLGTFCLVFKTWF